MLEILRSMFLSPPNDLSGLIQAISANAVDDTLARFFPQSDMLALAPYLDKEDLPRGHILTAKGALDRTLYFVETGSLRIHYGDKSNQYVIASVGPGSVVGEGAFFSELERNATVQASMPSRVWSLTVSKFAKIRKEHPGLALSLAMALGATISTRMLDVTRRASIT